MNVITSINPSNNQVIGSVDFSTKEDVLKKVELARSALLNWKTIGVEGRSAFVKTLITNLEKRKTEFAELISKEMGMPISQSIHDVSGSIDYLNWYVENAAKYLSPEVVFEDDSIKHIVQYEAVGVVATITPWNFPGSNFVWMVGQNLLVGNTVVFKDSEEVPLCSQFIESVFKESNFPEGVFSVVYGDGTVGDILVNADIDMICFTGSTKTGQSLYKVAADKFIKIFLELGGSAPAIVTEDADIDNVLDTIYANRFDNCGQICDGLKRLIVHKSRYAEIIEKLKSKLESVVVGDASDESTDIGPIVSRKQLDILDSQVNDAIKQGATIEYKKELNLNSKGNFYAPTLITNVSKEMRIWNEEVFGPVLPIVTFETEEEAIELANDTKYGLGGYVFTSSVETFNRIANQMNTGMVQMNNSSYINPTSPFGGCKSSGLGRAHGKFGFYELSQAKLYSVEK